VSAPFVVVKTGHSLNPWRIYSGEMHVIFEYQDMVIHGNDERVAVYGYPTKGEAVVALGRLAASLWDRAASSDDSGAFSAVEARA
jgi:hypothetical protein